MRSVTTPVQVRENGECRRNAQISADLILEILQDAVDAYLLSIPEGHFLTGFNVLAPTNKMLMPCILCMLWFAGQGTTWALCKFACYRKMWKLSEVRNMRAEDFRQTESFHRIPTRHAK